MTRLSRTVVVVAGTIVLTLSGGASGLTLAGGGSHDDGGGARGADALTRAAEVALAVTGGGRVTDTEVGDEESYYQVEITLLDSRQVDVQLDESFVLVDMYADVEDDGGADG